MFWPGASLRRYHGSNEVSMGVQTCVRFASLLKCQFNVAIIFSGGGEGAGGRGKGGGGRGEGEGGGGRTGRDGICWCLRNRFCDEIA